jgi:hypothetical protein
MIGVACDGEIGARDVDSGEPSCTMPGSTAGWRSDLVQPTASVHMREAHLAKVLRDSSDAWLTP